MSDIIRERIAVIQHKRRQSEAYKLLSAISDKLEEAHFAPVAAGDSLRIQSRLYENLKALRAKADLHSITFTTMEAAVDEFVMRASGLAPDAISEFYTGARGSGFFTGKISRAFLRLYLEQGCEGIALVQPCLAAGVLLDVVLDDPTRGDFCEVEWW